jgi:hypothetical protein
MFETSDEEGMESGQEQRQARVRYSPDDLLPSDEEAMESGQEQEQLES